MLVLATAVISSPLRKNLNRWSWAHSDSQQRKQIHMQVYFWQIITKHRKDYSNNKKIYLWVYWVSRPLQKNILQWYYDDVLDDNTKDFDS